MFEKLKEILAHYVEVENLEISENTDILRDLGINSYSMIEIANEIEEEFDAELPDSALAEIKTVGDLMKYLEENK